MLACCQKPDAKAADHGCLENLAHFELRFVKNLGTSPNYAFFVPTVTIAAPCRAAINKGQNPTNSGQASKTPSTSQAFGKSHDWHEFCLYQL